MTSTGFSNDARPQTAACKHGDLQLLASRLRYHVFTARRSYASAVFGVVLFCPSVCMSVTRVICD